MKNNFLTTILVISFLSIIPFNGFCQDVQQAFREGQRLEELRKDADALKKYQEVVKVQSSHLPALCKISELYCNMGSREPDKKTRMAYYYAAKKYAGTALKINPNYSDANFVMSMAMGRIALIVSGQEKIKAVNEIKRYAEIAVKADPLNFKAYHVLGKWHYEVSSLNAFERMGVKLFFGGFPPSSFNESIRHYEKSRAISPGFALNYLEVAKAYHQNGQDNKAIDVLRKLQALPLKSSEDPRIRKDADVLLKKLQS